MVRGVVMACHDGGGSGGSCGDGEMMAVVVSGGRRNGYGREWGKVGWLE